MGNSTRAAEDVREEVGTPSLTSASLFVALALLRLPPIAASLGSPFCGIITIPISIYRGGNGDDRLCEGSRVRRMGKGATSILQSVVWVSPKRQLRNATLTPSCAL